MALLRANVDFAKRIFTDRLGDPYVYGGNWDPFNLGVGTDCSGLVGDMLDAVQMGTAMPWRRSVTTESWPYDYNAGQPVAPSTVGPKGTIAIANVSDAPPDAAVIVSIHHGGGGADSHTNCQVDGMVAESNGDHGTCTLGGGAIPIDSDYWTDHWYLPGPIVDSAPAPPLSKSDGYALLIIQEGQRRGITPRGIQIALAAALVESNILIYANAAVPDSMNIPHDAVGSDGFSVGIFQQQVVMGDGGWWWGDAATCMDPTSSAGLFYNRLAGLDYNNPANSPGSYAQTVQQSAFPDRYDERFADAVNLYNRLVATAPPIPGDDDLSALAEQQIADIHRELTQLLTSRSPLRHLGEGPIDTMAGFLLNTDGSEHVEICRLLAGYGHPPILALLNEVAAADPVLYPDRQGDRLIAQAILADVTTPQPVAPGPTPTPAPAQPQYVPVYVPTPAPTPAPVPVSPITPAPNSSPGQIIGAAFDALDALNLSGILNAAEKAPLAAIIAVLQTKLGATA